MTVCRIWRAFAEGALKMMQRAKQDGVTRLGLFGSEDAAEALCLLAPGASMTGDLDQHIGLWDVNGVVTYLG